MIFLLIDCTGLLVHPPKPKPQDHMFTPDTTCWFPWSSRLGLGICERGDDRALWNALSAIIYVQHKLQSERHRQVFALRSVELTRKCHLLWGKVFEPWGLTFDFLKSFFVAAHLSHDTILPSLNHFLCNRKEYAYYMLIYEHQIVFLVEKSK